MRAENDEDDEDEPRSRGAGSARTAGTKATGRLDRMVLIPSTMAEPRHGAAFRASGGLTAWP